jgi:hypothetical protein
MKKRGRPVYRDVDTAWFDAEWAAGTSAGDVARGMQARGYVGFDAMKCRWLAKYRSINRSSEANPVRSPDIKPVRSKPLPVTVEAVVTRQLMREHSRPEDNRKAEMVRHHPAPVGGFRMGATR